MLFSNVVNAMSGPTSLEGSSMKGSDIPFARIGCRALRQQRPAHVDRRALIPIASTICGLAANAALKLVDEVHLLAEDVP